MRPQASTAYSRPRAIRETKRRDCVLPSTVFLSLLASPGNFCLIDERPYPFQPLQAPRHILADTCCRNAAVGPRRGVPTSRMSLSPIGKRAVYLVCLSL